MLPINFGYEVTTLGKLLAVTPFAKRFGYQVGDKWLIAATDQQILNAANSSWTTQSLNLCAFR